MARMGSAVNQFALCESLPGCAHCKEQFRCALSTLLPLKARENICKRKKESNLSKGDILFRAGEVPFGFWVVCRGHIKVSRLASDGKQLIMHVAQTGDTVGATPFFSRKPFEGSAVALESTMVMFLQGCVVEELIAHNSGFAISMLKHLANEVSNAESKAINMAYRSARDRVIGVLLDIHHHHRAHGNDGWSFSLPRRELAEQAGLTVETIVRVLKGLEKEGLLILEGRRIDVINRPRFASLNPAGF